MSTNNTNDVYFNEFTKPVRKIGKTFLLLAILFGFIPALYVGIRYDAMPTIGQFMGGWLMILSTEMAYYFVEPISYFPVLGEAGEYMSFLAGSIGAVRVPTVTVAQDELGVEPGSNKAEIVSTIAVAASVVCSLAMGFVAIIVGNLLFSVMPAFVQSMFDYVVPSLYGCLLMMRIPKDPSCALVAMVAALLLRFTAVIPTFLNMLIVVAVSVVYGIYRCKKMMKRQEKAANK